MTDESHPLTIEVDLTGTWDFTSHYTRVLSGQQGRGRMVWQLVHQGTELAGSCYNVAVTDGTEDEPEQIVPDSEGSLHGRVILPPAGDEPPPILLQVTRVNYNNDLIGLLFAIVLPDGDSATGHFINSRRAKGTFELRRRRG